jgi:glycosyltransferase involved in cell wall biosynthesis
MRILVRTHHSIFALSDTYLGYRKIRERPDLIHVQFPHLNHLNQADFLSKKFDCPFTITFRALDLYEKCSGKKEREKKKIITKAKKLVTISDFNRSMIKRKFGRDAEVVHSAINLEKFRPVKRKGTRNGPVKIVYIGRFVEKKGIEYLIDACSILKKRGRSFKLTLIGDGPLRRDYMRRIRKFGMDDLCVIKDLRPQEEIIRELNGSDIFALPCIVTSDGDRDILPNSMKESMAMELPIVTSDISGIEELVENEMSGLLVRSESSMEIADAIDRLISDDDLRERMGEEGRRKIEKDFNVVTEARKLNDIFKDVLEGK